MVCRSTPGNSAITTLARVDSGLHDVQVLSLFHEVRSEAPRTSNNPTATERRFFLDRMSQRLNRNPSLTSRRRTDLNNRVMEAYNRDVDGRTYYAWQNIEERAQMGSQAINAHFNDIASAWNTTPEAVRESFDQMMHRDHRVNGEQPSAPERVVYGTDNVPRDRGTRYALAMLYAAGPDVTRSPQSLATGHALIHRQSERLLQRANEAIPVQCPNCGEFMGQGHICSAPTSSPGSNDSFAIPSEDGSRLEIPGNRAVTQVAENIVYGSFSLGDGLYYTTDDESYVDPEDAIEHQQRLIREAALEEAIAHDHPNGDVQTLIRRFRAQVDRQSGFGVPRASDGTMHDSEQAAILHSLRHEMARMRDHADAFTARQEREREAEEARRATRTRCTECGEFMSADETHTCDPEAVHMLQTLSGEVPNPTGPRRNVGYDADAPLADWERDLLYGRGGGQDAEPIAEPVAPRRQPATPRRDANHGAFASTPVEEAPAAPVRRRTPLRSYAAGPNSVRMLNLSEIRAGFRNNTTGAPWDLDDTEVTLNSVDADGNTVHAATVTGRFTVTNTGQRRTRTRDRFTVAVEEPGQSRRLRCTCADYQRDYDCEHVRVAVEQVQAVLNERDPVATAPAVAMETVGAELRDDYDASLAAAQTARENFETSGDNVAYAENMAQFQSAWDEAKAHFESGETALPYHYENATNGMGARDGGRSIGIEIEVDFPDDMEYTAKQRVAREIYEAGLSDSAQVRPWHWRARSQDTRGRTMGGGYTDNPNMWSVEFDRSVDDVGGNRGCEVVSPILYDTPETWRNLKTVCDIIERNGGRVTPRTGLHINIGAADFNHTVGNHNRLIGMANAYEDVIVRTAHNPQAGSTHRGRDYCRPMTMPAAGFTSIREAQRGLDPQNYEGSSHRAMINLDHVPAEGAPVVNSTRVEVRIFDGSVDPGRIQANVNMSLALVNAAVRGVDVPSNPERAGTHRASNVGSNGRMRRLRGEAWESDTKSFRTFVDTLFSRERDKKQLTYAFAASRWQAR